MQNYICVVLYCNICTVLSCNLLCIYANKLSSLSFLDSILGVNTSALTNLCFNQ